MNVKAVILSGIDRIYLDHNFNRVLVNLDFTMMVIIFVKNVLYLVKHVKIQLIIVLLVLQIVLEYLNPISIINVLVYMVIMIKEKNFVDLAVNYVWNV